MQNKFDVLVIGSGFGGGTVALRLVQAGRSVCVLERGRRWRGKNLSAAAGDPDSTPFPQVGDSHLFWGRKFWQPTRQRLGLYDLKQLTNLQGLVGAGVGGGSLIWANVVIEAPEHAFASGWPSDINKQSLQPYYRKADPFLRPAYVPGTPGIPNSLNGLQVKRASMLKDAAERTGHIWKPVQIAVNFGNESVPALNGHGRARQLGCNYCGMCVAGCPQNAKNTVDITYIAQAEALGAQVRSLHEVTAIEPLARGYRVHYKRFDPQGRVCETGSLQADRVVICAGAFGTTSLLLKAKQRAQLPQLSRALGSRFSINGNVLGAALNPSGCGVNSPTDIGPSIASMIECGDCVVEDYANPTFTAGMVGTNDLGRLSAFLQALAGITPTPGQMAARTRDMLLYVGVGSDRALGKLRLNAIGGLSLDWPGGINNEPVVLKLHGLMAQLAASQGRRYIPNAFSVLGRLFTYHPLGGCPMADSSETGVVDSLGEVFGYPGLYVADGSMVPTAIGRNPSYTIAALAERVAEGIISGGVA